MYLKLKEDIVYKSDDTGAILFNKFTNQFIELTSYFTKGAFTELINCKFENN